MSPSSKTLQADEEERHGNQSLKAIILYKIQAAEQAY